MDFNFNEKYISYSNVELLKILREPSKYQDAAIDTAEQILKSREVTENDIEEVDIYFGKPDISKIKENEKLDIIKTNVTDFLQDILEPTNEVKPSKWLKVILLSISIQYVYTFYVTIKSFIFFINCDYCRFDGSVILQFIGLIYIPIIFFLLYKRKRWGWILLFADNLFALIAGIFSSYFFFKYQGIHHGNTFKFLYPIFIKGLFAVFLWRKEITHFFYVENITKNKTLVVTTLGTILFIAAIYYVLK
jgi:hypothetical protein